MNKNTRLVLFFVASIILLRGSINAEIPNPDQSEQKALQYYSDYKSVLICKISNVFYFQKVKTEHSEYHEYIVIVKILKSLKGDLVPGSQIACYVRYDEENLELKGDYFLGFNGGLNKVFVLENDNLCPVADIEKRNR